MLKIKIIFLDDVEIPYEVMKAMMKARKKVIIEESNINYNGNPSLGFTYGEVGVPMDALIQRLGSIFVSIPDTPTAEYERRYPFSKSWVKEWDWKGDSNGNE